MRGKNGLSAAALAVAVAMLLPAGVSAHDPRGAGYHGGPGMMGQGCPGMMGQGMGPGAMGQGMGPGMMGQGMGPGTMGQGMGPGTMGQGMGPGMMGVPWMGQEADRDLSADDVRQILEGRLAWHGNPHIKLGKVEEADADSVIAEIVTQEDSLVQRLEVDRHSGQMRQVP